MDTSCNPSKALSSALLSMGAVSLRPSDPFTWASGWRSPIYCDNRKVLSDPALRSSVAQWLAGMAADLYPEADVVAGVATGAIAHGVLVADRLGKPFCYVRPKPKDHGTKSRIEGVLPEGAKVVVVEDLVSTGMSSLEAVAALREAGAEVLGMVALFTYAFPVASERFSGAGVALDTISSYPDLLAEALEGGYITRDQLPVLEAWRDSPSTWGRD